MCGWKDVDGEDPTDKPALSERGIVKALRVGCGEWAPESQAERRTASAFRLVGSAGSPVTRQGYRLYIDGGRTPDKWD